MPIYEYRCSACGYEKDALQKLSDPPLRDCPECGESALVKLISAAGFQLKGSGWYATDFKSSGTKPKTEPGKTEPKSGEASAADSGTSSEKGTNSEKSSTAATTEATKPATPPAPGG